MTEKKKPRGRPHGTKKYDSGPASVQFYVDRPDKLAIIAAAEISRKTLTDYVAGIVVPRSLEIISGKGKKN